MVGWVGAAALALVGGLKGQGNLKRQIPLLGVLTAIFISWNFRDNEDEKLKNLDDETMIEVNSREYLVQDEEQELENSSTSGSASSSFDIHSEQTLEELRDSDHVLEGSLEDLYTFQAVSDTDAGHKHIAGGGDAAKEIHRVECGTYNSKKRQEALDVNLPDDAEREIEMNGIGAPGERVVYSLQTPREAAGDLDDSTLGELTEEPANDKESATSREVTSVWFAPDMELNAWISEKDSEVEAGGTFHPKGSDTASSSLSLAVEIMSHERSESCSSSVGDTSNEDPGLQSPSNVMRVVSSSNDLDEVRRKANQAQYAEKIQVYDGYLADPSLSPNMRSQVLRAKATLKKCYDSD